MCMCWCQGPVGVALKQAHRQQQHVDSCLCETVCIRLEAKESHSCCLFLRSACAMHTPALLKSMLRSVRVLFSIIKPSQLDTQTVGA